MCTVCACFVYCDRLLPNKCQRYKEYANSFFYFSALLAPVTRSRSGLGQHLIAIRSPEIHGDHVLSGTSLIRIIYIAGLSHLLTRHCDCVYSAARCTAGRTGAVAASAASCVLCGEIKGRLNVGHSRG